MKKTRGKKIAAIIIILFLFIGCTKIAVENTPEEDKTPQTVSKELTQENKDDYKKNVYEVMSLYLMQYDAVIENLNETINAMAAGNIDSYNAYKSVDNSKNNLNNCWKAINKIETPKYLNKEQKELFENAKDDIVSAIMTRTSAVENMAKMLDNGQIQNSKLKEIEDLNTMANNYLISGIAKKQELDKIMGITTENN